jgi:hypothetical protein
MNKVDLPKGAIVVENLNLSRRWDLSGNAYNELNGTIEGTETKERSPAFFSLILNDNQVMLLCQQAFDIWKTLK